MLSIMQIADLLFLLAMLAIFLTAWRVSWRLIRRDAAAASRAMRQGTAVGVCYMVALLATSAIQPGRVVPLAEDECFDDWCIAVMSARLVEPLTPRRGVARVMLRIRISNRGRGRAQAEPDAYVYLRSQTGERLDPVVPSGDGPSIGDRVPAGGAAEVDVAFDVPSDFAVDGLVKAQRFNFPGVVLIGGSSSLWHRPTVHALGALGS